MPETTPHNCNFCWFSDKKGGCDVLDSPPETKEEIAQFNVITEWVCETGPSWSGVMPPTKLETPPCPGFEHDIVYKKLGRGGTYP